MLVQTVHYTFDFLRFCIIVFTMTWLFFHFDLWRGQIAIRGPRRYTRLTLSPLRTKKHRLVSYFPSLHAVQMITISWGHRWPQTILSYMKSLRLTCQKSHISWQRTARSYLSVSRPRPLGCRLWLWVLSQNSWPFSSSQASYPSVYLSHRSYAKFYADANEPSLSLRHLKLLPSDVCLLKAHPGNPPYCSVFRPSFRRPQHIFNIMLFLLYCPFSI